MTLFLQTKNKWQNYLMSTLRTLQTVLAKILIIIMEKVFTTTQALRLFKRTTVKGDEDCLSLQLTNATQIEEKLFNVNTRKLAGMTCCPRAL